MLEKGKPSERVGRKATGLSLAPQDMAAGLPGESSIPCILNLAWYNIRRGAEVTFFRLNNNRGHSLLLFAVAVGAIFLLALASSLHAATYYVDATGGQDSNDGLSQGTAWKTISKVNASSFSPGDQVLLKRGEIWRETLVVSSSGSPGNPIVFGAYGIGADPILKGSNIVTNMTPMSSIIWKATVTTEPKVVLFDRVRGQNKASVGALSSAGDWFWGSNTLYVYAASDPDALYTSPGIEAMARNHGVYASGKSHITVQDLNITGGNSYPIIFAWNGTGSDIIVQRCTVSYGNNTGIWFIQNHAEEETTGVLVDSCTVYENGNSGICIDGGIKAITVSNNTVHHNNWQNAWNHSGIKSFATKGDLIVERNVVYSQYDGVGFMWTTGSGIWLDTPSPGSIVRYNYIYDNPTVGIVIEYTDNTEIYYNLITGNGTSDDADTGGSGILIFRHSSGTKIYNNTLYGNRAGIALRGADANERNMRNNLIKNNICHNSANEELIATFGAENDGTMGSGNVYTYNGFGSERANFIRWGSGVFKATYAAFDSAYGSATHSIGGNPLFVNPTGTPPDFHLLSNSPCIDAGTDVGLTSDRDGNGKYGAAWDIGAYEWRPSSSLSPPQNIRIVQ